MTSSEIRAASTATLKNIIAGLVRVASDSVSKHIAYGELERRGAISRRF